MQLSSLTVVAALALAAVASPTNVFAANCTDAQLKQLDDFNTSAVEQACPALFADERASPLDPARVDSFTAEALKQLEPCKEKACLDELKKLVDSAPDCTASGLNPKAMYGVSVTLCSAFNDGVVSVQKATDILKDVAKNLTNAFEDFLNGSDGEDEGSAGETPAGATTQPTIGSEETPTTTTPAATSSPSTTASPTPVPTSTSSGAKVLLSGAFVVTVLAMSVSL